MTPIRHLAVGILHARKVKLTVADMMERSILNRRTIFGYLIMAKSVIPNPIQNY